MLRLYSKACEYALMALTNLSLEEMNGRFSVKELCCQPHIKESYARKAFQSLSQAGILEAVTGPGGGYKFVKDPDKITLLEVVKAIDGKECFDSCVLGLPQCSDHSGCPMHQKWKPLKTQVLSSLKKVTLGEIIRLDERKKKER